MGHIYSIKPIHTLNELLFLKNEAFRDVIRRGKPRNDAILDGENRFIIDKYLGSFFSRFAKPCGECFSPLFRCEPHVRGRLNLLAELCMKGDFGLYEKYIATLTKYQLRFEDTHLLNGVFALMVLFMRFDLMENYIHCQDKIWEVNEILHFVLDPTIMIEYKNLLLKDGMIPLTKEDEFRMDIIKNTKTYHPKQRILMFRKLCYSTSLGFSYAFRGKKYWEDYEIYTHEKLRELINNIYDSFDYFVSKWHLMEYKDIANDETLQHEMHNQVKMLIQYFFGFAHLSLAQSQYNACLNDNQRRGNTITCAYIRDQGIECTICPDYQFIDLLPQNEKELETLFYNVYMDNNEKWVNNLHRNTITHYLQYPRYDNAFEQEVQPKNSKPFHFDIIPQDKLFEFFNHVWQIGH